MFADNIRLLDAYRKIDTSILLIFVFNETFMIPSQAVTVILNRWFIEIIVVIVLPMIDIVTEQSSGSLMGE